MYQLRTKNGHDLFECVSALQKEIRRGNKYEATYWALEIYNSNYVDYVWNRLMVISVEDVADPMIHLACKSMMDAFNYFKEKKNKTHRIFLTKCVLTLCEADKNRNADHFQNLVDKRIENGETLTIPEYALDIHTKKGKKSGKTKYQFFVEEYNALKPLKEDQQDKDAAFNLFSLF